MAGDAVMPPLRCPAIGCAAPFTMDLRPDDPWHVVVRHGEGEAALTVPLPASLNEQHLDVLTRYIAQWCRRVHAYEDERP